MSPGFMAATAFSATAPTQSSAKAIGRPTMGAAAAATRFSESFGSRPLRPAEMREQDDLAALVGDFPDRRRRALDARRVREFAVVHRHVEIDAHEHALALHVGVVEAAERSHLGAKRIAAATMAAPAPHVAMRATSN